jgi:hypothetical protein
VPVKQNKRGLSESEFLDMQEMLRSLTPAERRDLADPDFKTEDETDVIVAMRRDHGKSHSFAEVLHENGIEHPRKRQPV